MNNFSTEELQSRLALLQTMFEIKNKQAIDLLREVEQVIAEIMAIESKLKKPNETKAE